MRFYCYSYRAREKGAELRLKHKADLSTDGGAGNFDALAKVYCKSMEALLFTSIDLKKRMLLEQKIIRVRE